MSPRSKRAPPLGIDDVRAILLALPGVEEGPCYGTPGFRVRKKILARLKEDCDTLALRVEFIERDVLLRDEPDAFYLTDHYRGYPMVLVRLSRVRRELLHELLIEAWRRAASKRLIAEHDAVPRA